jgi:hypothetical protein
MGTSSWNSICFPWRAPRHFKLESDHHGEVWFQLETFCLHPREIRRVNAQVAVRLEQHAVELGCDFVYAERFVDATRIHDGHSLILNYSGECRTTCGCLRNALSVPRACRWKSWARREAVLLMATITRSKQRVKQWWRWTASVLRDARGEQMAPNGPISPSDESVPRGPSGARFSQRK